MSFGNIQIGVLTVKQKRFPFLLPVLLTLVLAVILYPAAAGAAAVGTAFTYQGQLLESGKPANGSYDFQFALYDAESGGAQIGGTLSQTLTVSSAYFSTSLDFGVGVFSGNAYWLEIKVSPAGAGSYTTLSPRQPLNPAPYALCAVSVIDGAVSEAKLADGAVTTGKIADSAVTTAKIADGTVGTSDIQGGAVNASKIASSAVTSSHIDSSGITDGKVLAANGGANPVWKYADRLSGNGTVVGMQVFPGSDNNHPNVVGGTNNTVAEYAATVSGGYNNKATKQGAAVGGGTRNEATGAYATVPGGYQSIATGAASFAAGAYNKATGDFSAAIGSYNTASGIHSLAIGTQVFATGTYSIAMGAGADTNGKDGAFVLGDDTYFSTLMASADNQFNARFANGYRLYTNGLGHPEDGSGVILTPGSGSWAAASDRALKENFAPVSANEVLQNLAAIPIQAWNYKDQDDSVRHIGPVAQDFYAAFGVGEDDKHINTVDADGVALVSIQELYRLLQEKDDEIQANQAQLQELQARLTALENAAAGH